MYESANYSDTGMLVQNAQQLSREDDLHVGI